MTNVTSNADYNSREKDKASLSEGATGPTGEKVDKSRYSPDSLADICHIWSFEIRLCLEVIVIV